MLAPAHILSSENSGLQIVAGEFDVGSSSENFPPKTIIVESIIVHEDYIRSNRSYDIALLVLREAMELHEYLNSICLPRKYEFPNDKPCLIVGWDPIRFANITSDNIPFKVEVPIINWIRCKETFELPEDASLGCAGEAKVSFAAAKSVEGWPLFCPSEDHSGHYYQQGIVTKYFEDHLVFTDVFRLQSWIHTKLESLVIDPNWYIPSFTSRYGRVSGA